MKSFSTSTTALSCHNWCSMSPWHRFIVASSRKGCTSTNLLKKRRRNKDLSAALNSMYTNKQEVDSNQSATAPPLHLYCSCVCKCERYCGLVSGACQLTTRSSTQNATLLKVIVDLCQVHVNQLQDHEHKMLSYLLMDNFLLQLCTWKMGSKYIRANLIVGSLIGIRVTLAQQVECKLQLYSSTQSLWARSEVMRHRRNKQPPQKWENSVQTNKQTLHNLQMTGILLLLETSKPSSWDPCHNWNFFLIFSCRTRRCRT